MRHYFSDPEDPLPKNLREIHATIFGHDLTFYTAPGVFSGSRLDPGTAVLLRTVEPPAAGHILDLGCGFGPIAIGLAYHSEQVSVDAVDVNTHALQLTELNAARAGIGQRITTGTPETLTDSRYAQIWSNPPIRIGKQALHELLLSWLPRLDDGGIAYLVVSKNLGGDSLATWLTNQGWPTSKLASAKGFRVLRVAAQ